MLIECCNPELLQTPLRAAHLDKYQEIANADEEKRDPRADHLDDLNHVRAAFAAHSARMRRQNGPIAAGKRVGRIGFLVVLS